MWREYCGGDEGEGVVVWVKEGKGEACIEWEGEARMSEDVRETVAITVTKASLEKYQTLSSLKTKTSLILPHHRHLYSTPPPRQHHQRVRFSHPLHRVDGRSAAAAGPDRWGQNHVLLRRRQRAAHRTKRRFYWCVDRIRHHALD